MMKILFAASEIYPLIKTGGLADVAGALPIALRKKGCDVRLIMPAYKGILDKVAPIHNSINLGNPFGVGDLILLETHLVENDTPIWLVQCQALFERDGGPYVDAQGYDYPDNHIRFAAFSWVVALLTTNSDIINWQAEIVHLNDWQTGLTAAYLKSWQNNQTAVVTTVHNLRYNGSFGYEKYHDLQLPYDMFNMHGLEFYGQFSALKAGLVYADAITTVSPTYAEEILTPAYGDGLDGVLTAMQDKLSGILNGVDYDQWSPEKDTLLSVNYDINNLSLKQENKRQLLAECGLAPQSEQPVFGIVSRLTEQKGLDLVLDVMPSMLDQGCQLVILGSGDKYLEEGYLNLQQRYPNQVSVRIGYMEDYSHRLQAGVDALLIPSRFEPCGLTQLYALKYGTLPVVRQTGGLADTVFEDGERANGFVFQQANSEDLGQALQRTITAFHDNELWRTRQRNAMSYDYSWQAVTDQWLNLYQSLLKR